MCGFTLPPSPFSAVPLYPGIVTRVASFFKQTFSHLMIPPNPCEGGPTPLPSGENWGSQESNNLPKVTSVGRRKRSLHSGLRCSSPWFSLCRGLTPEPGPQGLRTPVCTDSGSEGRPGLPRTCNLPLWGGPGDHHPFPEGRAGLSPAPAINQLYLLQPECPAAAGPSHPTSAVAPNPHLQPSSSSSWPLPHVWFPLATRQTLGVALSSGGRPPFGRASSFLPSQASCPALAPGTGRHPQPHILSLR